MADLLREIARTFAYVVAFSFGGVVGAFFLLGKFLSTAEALVACVILFSLLVLTIACGVLLRRTSSSQLEIVRLSAELLEHKFASGQHRSLVQRHVVIVNELLPDGTWTSNLTYRVEVLNDGRVGFIPHWSRSLYREFRSYRCAGWMRISPEHTWRFEVIKSGQRRAGPIYVELLFFIDPPLLAGETAEYGYRQQHKPAMPRTKNELAELVAKRRFLRDLLREVRLYTIECQTDRLTRTIIFHNTDIVQDPDVLALHRDNVDESETARARKSFSVKRVNSTLEATLDLDSPELNFTYAITWSVPDAQQINH